MSKKENKKVDFVPPVIAAEPGEIKTDSVRQEMVLISKLHKDDASVLVQIMSNQATILNCLKIMMDQKLTEKAAAEMNKRISDCMQASAAVQAPVFNRLAKK